MAEITKLNLSKFRQLTALDVLNACAGSIAVSARGRGVIFVLRCYEWGDGEKCAHVWQWSKFRNATVAQFGEALVLGSILLTVDNVSSFVVERPGE